MADDEKIRHVSWRDGRPRFNPGRNLRIAGHKSRDLRHEDGAWYTFDEALEETVKIGFSANPWARALDLISAIGAPVHLYVTMPGTVADEVRLHKRLAAQRVRDNPRSRELFHANDYTLEVIKMAIDEQRATRATAPRVAQKSY